jgi:hypothetical protein
MVRLTRERAGAIIRVAGDKLELKKYRNQPHPYGLPGFLDGFSWSVPFMAQRSTFLVSRSRFSRCCSS